MIFPAASRVFDRPPESSPRSSLPSHQLCPYLSLAIDRKGGVAVFTQDIGVNTVRVDLSTSLGENGNGPYRASFLNRRFSLSIGTILLAKSQNIHRIGHNKIIASGAAAWILGKFSSNIFLLVFIRSSLVCPGAWATPAV